MLATMTWVSSSFASLLNVTLTYPEISANSASVYALTYTPTTNFVHQRGANVHVLRPLCLNAFLSA